MARRAASPGRLPGLGPEHPAGSRQDLEDMETQTAKTGFCSPSPKAGAGQRPYSTQGTACPAPGQARAREERQKGNQPLGGPCRGPGSGLATALPFL